MPEIEDLKRLLALMEGAFRRGFEAGELCAGESERFERTPVEVDEAWIDYRQRLLTGVPATGS